MLDFYVSPINLSPIIFDNEAAATLNTPPPFSQTFEGVSNTAAQPSLIVENQDTALMLSSDSDLSMATQTQEIFSGLSNEEWETLQALVSSDVSDQHVTKAAVTTVSSSQDKRLNSLPAKDQSDSLSQQERLLQVEHQLLAEFKADASLVPQIVKVLRVWQNNLQVPEAYRMRLQRFVAMLHISPREISKYVSKDTGIINAQGLAILDCAKQASINEAHFPADQHQLRMQFANTSLRVLQLLQAWQSNLQRPKDQRVNLKQFANIYKTHYCNLTPYIQNDGSFREMGLDILQKATLKEKEITFFSIENKIEHSIQVINESDELEKVAQSFLSSEEWAEMESNIMTMLDIENEKAASVEQIMRPMQNNQGNSIDKTFSISPTKSVTEKTAGPLSKEEWRILQEIVFSHQAAESQLVADAQKNAGNDFPELRKLLVDKAPIIKPQDDYLYSIEDELLERFQRDHSALPAISKILKIWQMNQQRQEGKRVKLERFAEIFKIDLRRLISYIDKDTGDFRTLGLEMLQTSRIIHSKEEDILVKQFSRAEYKIRGFLQAWESNQQFPENKRVSYTRFAHLLGITITELNQYVDRETRQFKELGLKILHRRY